MRIFAFTFVAILLAATEAVAVVNGGIDISYRNYQTKGAQTTENTVLTQRYNVNYRGGLYNRRLATLNTGLTYDLQDNKYANQQSSSKNLGFNLTTVILPKSPIPFTIYMNRYTTDSQSRPDPGYTMTTTLLGFYWVLPFRGVIPEINMSYNQSHVEDNNPANPRDKTDRVTSLVLSKRRKLSYYSFTYRNSMAESEGGQETTHNVDLRGWYKLSSRSIIDINSSFQDSPGGQEDFETRVHYDITFSREASLRADYQFSQKRNDTATFNQNNFSTSLYYRPRAKVTTTTSYSYGVTDSDDSASSSHYFSESVTYMPLTTLTLNGDASFNTQESDSSSSNSSRYNLSALYHKPFSRAQWSLGATAGYSTMSTGASSDTTFTRSEYTGLASRNLRYMSATASLANYSTRNDTASRDEYLFATTVSSNYFRRLNLSTTYNYNISEEKTASSPSYRRDYSMLNVTGSYNMWYGMTVGAGYSLRMGSDTDPEADTYLDWNWNFVMFRRIWVGMTARRSEKISDGINDSVSYTYSSKLSYRIGRLALSVEYSYLRDERKNSNSEERSYFVRATRTF